MTTTPRHLELFIRNGKTAAQCRTETDGRLDDPKSIAVAGPEWSAFVADFGATQAAEIASLTAGRDEAVAALETQRATMQAEIDRLTALVPPPMGPREITPREFLNRISDEDKLAIMQSKDPRCLAAMWTLFTTLSVDLDSPLLADLIDALIDAGIEIDDAEREAIFA